MPLPPITDLLSPRLRVRPVAAADLPDLMAVNGDAEVTRFLPYATWQSPADAEAWLVRMRALDASGISQQLVLERREDGRVIGTALLFRHDEASGRAELGYVLGRAHWGQGLMREALQALCGHAFGPLGLRRLEAEVNPANTASTGLLRALGFTQEGCLRQRWVAKGSEPYDTHFFGLLAHEWVATPAGSRMPGGPIAAG
jgi:[ribosomal protein S5]-alanine N-acetyltransferase